MLIHLGEAAVVSADDVVIMMDMDKATTSKGNREFLKNCEANRKVIDASAPLIPRTYVVTTSGDVYLSSILVSTLLRKIER